MSASAVAASLATKDRRRVLRARPRRVPARPQAIEVTRAPPFELDTISSKWQLALDSAQRALAAAGGLLPAAELGRRTRRLAEERQQTAEALARLARATGVRSARPSPSG